MAAKKFQKEFRVKTVGFIAAALGLVVGLAWNDAIKTLIETLFPIKGDTVLLKFVYAFVLTIIVVSVIILLMRFVEEKTEEKE